MSSTSAAAVPWYRKPAAWVRKLYDWTLSWAYTPYGAPALFLLAFFEASFFPIPADVLLIALAMSQRERAYRWAAICTAGSVAGALLGWYIGFGLWRSMGIAMGCPEFGGGALLFDAVPGFTCDKFGVVRGLYEQNAFLYLLVSAFTPIPYKLFTVASGVFSVNLAVLVGASILGRAARFFLVAALIHRFGPPIREFIERRFELMTVLFTILLVGGFAVVKLLL